MTMTIQQIANSSEVAKAVFKALSDKQRTRRATDLTNLYREMVKTDKNLKEEEFLKPFKLMQDNKLGSLVIGRRSHHNRFLWNYSLKDIARAAFGKLAHEELSKVTVSKGRIKVIKPVLPKKTVKVIEKEVEKAQASGVEAYLSKSSTQHPATLHVQIPLNGKISADDIKALIELLEEREKK